MGILMGIVLSSLGVLTAIKLSEFIDNAEYAVWIHSGLFLSVIGTLGGITLIIVTGLQMMGAL